MNSVEANMASVDTVDTTADLVQNAVFGTPWIPIAFLGLFGIWLWMLGRNTRLAKRAARRRMAGELRVTHPLKPW